MVAKMHARATERSAARTVDRHDPVHAWTQHAIRSEGRSLDEPVRASMGQSFGFDFGGVRIHDDGRANESARALGARAYTVGRDVVFSEGAYRPSTVEGRRLLAHELTHVVQQSGASASPTLQASLEVARPDDPLESEADRVAEAVATPCRKCSKYHEPLSGLGLPSEEQPYEEAWHTDARGPSKRLGSISRRPVAVQRTASFVAGQVHETFNLAERVLSGGGAGFTPPLLNGTQILSAATARSRLVAPTLGGRSTASGVETWVATVGTNTGSFDETVLAPPPWTTVTTKAAINARFGLAQCTGAGNTTFRANGLPTDAARRTQNRNHEDLHAADHERVFNNLVVPWDANLENARRTNQIFSGPDVATAEASLWAAMGGTPDVIATNLNNQWIAANNALHATPQGRTAVMSNPQADATCTTSSVDVT